MLALLWATKYFRCYLYGCKFLLKTEHSALTYLRKFADQNSRLLRWSLKLSEFQSAVEHRPGSKIGHVDALSRHVGVVKQNTSLDREGVIRKQAGDAFCSQQNQDTYRSKSDFFFDDDGLLYKWSSNGSH